MCDRGRRKMNPDTRRQGTRSRWGAEMGEKIGGSGLNLWALQEREQAGVLPGWGFHRARPDLLLQSNRLLQPPASWVSFPPLLVCSLHPMLSPAPHHSLCLNHPLSAYSAGPSSVKCFLALRSLSPCPVKDFLHWVPAIPSTDFFIAAFAQL